MSDRLLIFNDLHYTRHAPECRADTYPHEVLDKLHATARLAQKLGVKEIGCTGDWFHRKGKVTFTETNDLLAVLTGWKQKGIDAFGVLGNHDIAGHSLTSLDSRAVGSMVHSRALHLLDHEPLIVGGFYVTGCSYFHGCDADDDARARMYGAPKLPWEPGDPRLVHVHLAHGTLLQKGTFFEDYTVAGELIELLHGRDRLPDVLVCGHLHYSEGIKLYQHPGGGGKKVAVCRIGSLARVASEDFDRQPQVLLVAAREGAFVCKPISVGEDVNRGGETPEHKNTAEHEERIQEFVRVLREEADEWELADHRALLRRVTEEMGFGPEIYEAAVGAVERRQ